MRTNHSALEDLRKTGVQIVKARVVDDGDLVSFAGVRSGLELALWLVEMYFRPTTAAGLENRLEYERRDPLWRRDGR
jgi:transcriptional regulator GlxA family with amidase domain